MSTSTVNNGGGRERKWKIRATKLPKMGGVFVLGFISLWAAHSIGPDFISHISSYQEKLVGFCTYFKF